KKQTLHQKLESLYWQHGYHGENVLNLFMEGSEGMKRMQALMAKLRAEPPKTLAGLAVTRLRDYQSLTTKYLGDGRFESLDAPKGDMVIMDLAAEGNYIAVRPSGTEPKVKFYMFTLEPAEQLHNLETTKQEMADRMSRAEAELRMLADTV